MLPVVMDQVDTVVSQQLDGCTEIEFERKVDEAVRSRLEESPRNPERWGIILAGGDGTRILGSTRLISGDDRPVQFCPINGTETLVQQAGRRATRSIAPEQTIVTLMRAHTQYYSRDLAGTRFKRLVQPCNRGTAPPIIISLLHISRMNPAALVAILPGDHYYSDDSVLTSALEWAFEAAGSDRSSIILLGAQPSGPEIRFGWIELGTRVEGDLFRVSSFREKPTPEAARRLLAGGAIWNTSVVVGSVDALIEMAFGSVPDLVASFFFGLGKATDDSIVRIPDPLYHATPPTDFSVRILWPNAKSLNALRLHSMDWQDYGRVDRALGVIGSRDERIPKGVHAWESARHSSQAIQPHKRR